jgi:deoxycytidylate deaminase
MESRANSSFFRRLEDTALSLIDWNESKRCRHFSFVIYKKRVVSIGWNSSKTHPTNLINRKISAKTGEDFSEQKYVCSELNAINKLKRLTNIKYDRNKKLAFAKPCMSCKSLLKYNEFKSVLYTNDRGVYERL